MACKNGQKKLFWSNEDKVLICAQTGAPGISLAPITRLYAMNGNLIHKSPLNPKFAADPKILGGEAIETPCFLPVNFVDRTSAKDTTSSTITKPIQSAIEIEIADDLLPPKARCFELACSLTEETSDEEKPFQRRANHWDIERASGGA